MARKSRSETEKSSPHADIILFWPSGLGSEDGWIIGWRFEHTWLVAGIVHEDHFEQISSKMKEFRTETCFCCSCDATTQDYPTRCGGCTRKLCFETIDVLACSSRNNLQKHNQVLPLLHVSQDQIPLYFTNEDSPSRVSFRQVVMYDSGRSPSEQKRRLEDIILYNTPNSSSSFSKEVLGRITHASAVLQVIALPEESSRLPVDSADQPTEDQTVEDYVEFIRNILSSIPFQSYFLEHLLREPPLVQILRAVASTPKTKSAILMGCQTCNKLDQHLVQSHHADIDQVISRLDCTIRCVVDVMTGVLGGLALPFLQRHSSASFLFAALLRRQFDWLRMLLDWMETFPIGFKLNVKLTFAMGKAARAILVLQDVFVYKLLSAGTYFFFKIPFLPLLLGLLVGGSGMLILLCDICRLATLHVTVLAHAFHWFFSVEVFVLRSSWRLFRGKKRNILRQRTDTMNYDSTQLLFGTILFTAALFLFTTVLVYNVVFSSLHLFLLFMTRVLLAIAFMLHQFDWGHIWLRLTMPNWFVANIHLVDGPQTQEGRSTESDDQTFLVPQRKSIFALIKHEILRKT